MSTTRRTFLQSIVAALASLPGIAAARKAEPEPETWPSDYEQQLTVFDDGSAMRGDKVVLDPMDPLIINQKRMAHSERWGWKLSRQAQIDINKSLSARLDALLYERVSGKP